jgi:hypothetical protein
MASVTRTPACTVKGCPAPRDPDWHVPICGHGLEGHHHHVIKRSQGGKDGPQVFICPDCHHNIDNGEWGNAAKHVPGRGLVYFAWDLHGNTLIEKEVMPNAGRTPHNIDQREVGRESGLVLSDGAEAGGRTPDSIATIHSVYNEADSSAPSPSAGVLSDGAEGGTAGSTAEHSTAKGQGNAPASQQRQGKGYVTHNILADLQYVHGQGREDEETPSAPSLSTKEESDGEHDLSEAEGETAAVLNGKAPQVGQHNGGDERELRGGDDGGVALVQKMPPNPDSLRGGELTHEQRVAIAQEIHDTEWNRQWFAGDTGNLWIEQLGESAEQYLSDFGYVHESLANILRVCAAIPPAYRNGNLRFSHHVVVYDENLEDMEMHLAECEEKQWSVAEFRRQRKGTKKKVKRWSREELVAEVGQFLTGRDVYTEALDSFLDWLGEQA